MSAPVPASGEWLAEHWWLLWAPFAVSAIIAYRLRRDGGDGSLPRRIASPLFNLSGSRGARPREVTAPVIVLVFAGVVLAALAAGLAAWLAA
jgi:hypothetical protein